MCVLVVLKRAFDREWKGCLFNNEERVLNSGNFVVEKEWVKIGVKN